MRCLAPSVGRGRSTFWPELPLPISLPKSSAARLLVGCTYRLGRTSRAPALKSRPPSLVQHPCSSHALKVSIRGPESAGGAGAAVCWRSGVRGESPAAKCARALGCETKKAEKALLARRCRGGNPGHCAFAAPSLRAPTASCCVCRRRGHADCGAWPTRLTQAAAAWTGRVCEVTSNGWRCLHPAARSRRKQRAQSQTAFHVCLRQLQRGTLTRQIALPTSSATSKAPCLSITTPTGLPSALPSSLRKPLRTSIGMPDGLPFTKGTNITL